MIRDEALYAIGFFLAAFYLLTGMDDFIWDILTLFRRRAYHKQRLNPRQLDSIPPKLLAVAIAAWHEDNVLGDVIENILASTHYPKSMYHIFLGVYPNDDATVEVARALAAKYPNVHCVINCLPGPTSKAQNINHVIRQIKEFEQGRGWRFASLTIHDSEDVVHPYELKVTNFLLDKHQAMQFPVFPLMQMPTLRRFFKTITAGTYADEFAENHFTTMVSRYNSGAFVPSAGTGFALSRETLDTFGDEDVLPSNSLTEDYRLSLTLFERGIQMYYVLEKVPRVTERDTLAWDFIATRSMFPNSFKTAVKQKSRWILGITMQSFKFSDIFKTKGLRFAGRYSLYKDIKAKIGNLLVFVGYPVLIYFILSLFMPLTPIYPAGSLSWYMSLVVTVMMVERQIFRAVAISNVYGLRSMFFSCLFPPLMPLRILWGNVINMVSTLKAYKQSIFGNQQKIKKESQGGRKTLKTGEKKRFAWAKTDHTFLAEAVLKRYHRKLGDILLEKGYVTVEQLQAALAAASARKMSIGAYLRDEGMITEAELLLALASVKHIQYTGISSLEEYPMSDFAQDFEEKLLRGLYVVPLMRTETGYVIAFCDRSPPNAQSTLRDRYGITVSAIFSSERTIAKALNIMYPSGAARSSPVKELHDKGIINYEQVIIANNHIYAADCAEEEILTRMGLLTGQAETPAGFMKGESAAFSYKPREINYYAELLPLSALIMEEGGKDEYVTGKRASLRGVWNAARGDQDVAARHGADGEAEHKMLSMRYRSAQANAGSSPSAFQNQA